MAGLSCCPGNKSLFSVHGLDMMIILVPGTFFCTGIEVNGYYLKGGTPSSLLVYPVRTFLPRRVAMSLLTKIGIGCLASLLLLTSCSMVLQPTTSFDRRWVASSYGKILNQSNPDCDNCTDRFLVKKANGDLCSVVVGYDGRVKVLE